jgi:broad specificity phosphatase PhoE
MTTLHLIRHGKASPGKASYDELHAIGEQQSRLLGAYLGAQGRGFDAIYCGPLSRQVNTLRLMREAGGETARGWPETLSLDSLAEAPIEAVVKQCLPARLSIDPHLQALVRELGDGTDKARAQTGFAAISTYIVELWVTGELSGSGIETAAEFGSRVRAALAEILAQQGSGREVAVITSNGVIGWLIAHAQGDAQPDRSGPGRRLHNSSITRLRVVDAGLRVTALNLVEHLADPTLHTFI